MKKRVFAVVMLSALLYGVWSGVFAVSGNLTERGNNRESIDAAREIANLDGVKEVAVLTLDGYVIAGVSVSDNADCEEICIQGEDILRRVFPDAEMYRIEADNQWSDKVIELSFYLDTKVRRRVLKKRFLYLVTENREI